MVIERGRFTDFQFGTQTSTVSNIIEIVGGDKRVLDTVLDFFVDADSGNDITGDGLTVGTAWQTNTKVATELNNYYLKGGTIRINYVGDTIATYDTLILNDTNLGGFGSIRLRSNNIIEVTDFGANNAIELDGSNLPLNISLIINNFNAEVNSGFAFINSTNWESIDINSSVITDSLITIDTINLFSISSNSSFNNCQFNLNNINNISISSVISFNNTYFLLIDSLCGGDIGGTLNITNSPTNYLFTIVDSKDFTIDSNINYGTSTTNLRLFNISNSRRINIRTSYSGGSTTVYSGNEPIIDIINSNDIDFLNVASAGFTLTGITDRVNIDSTSIIKTFDENFDFLPYDGNINFTPGAIINDIDASEIAYDNTTSGLIGITVQEAIDELESKSNNKTIINSLTNFYVDGVNGNNSNDGSLGSPWLDVTFALDFIIDNFIINDRVIINLIDNSSFNGNINFQSAEGTGIVTLKLNNNTLNIPSVTTIQNIKTLNSFIIEGTTFTNDIGIITGDILTFLDCISQITLFDIDFQNIRLVFEDCLGNQNLLQESAFLINTILTNCILEFNSCIKAEVDGIDIVGDSSITFDKCAGRVGLFGEIIIKQNIIQGIPYFNIINCPGFVFDEDNLIIESNTLSKPILRFVNSNGIFDPDLLINDSGGNVTLNLDTNRYFVEIEGNSFLDWGLGSTAFIDNSLTNRGLLIKNSSSVVQEISNENDILNLPFLIPQINDISVEASVLENDYDNTISGLNSTTKKEAIDELNSNRILTERRFGLVSGFNLLNSDKSLQHLQQTTGSNLNIGLPVSPITDKIFVFVNNVASSVGSTFTVNGTIVQPNDRYEIIYDGVEWVEL